MKASVMRCIVPKTPLLHVVVEKQKKLALDPSYYFLFFGLRKEQFCSSLQRFHDAVPAFHWICHFLGVFPWQN
jgi:hypothetical protein